MSCWKGLACVGAGLAGAALAALSAYGLMEADRAEGSARPAAAGRYAGASAGALVEASASGPARPLCAMESAREPGAVRLRGAAAGDAPAAWLVGPAGEAPPPRPPAPGLHAAESLRLDRPLRLGAGCDAEVRAALARGSAVCLVESVLLDPESRAPVAVRFHDVALGGGGAPAPCPLRGAAVVVWAAPRPAPVAAVAEAP